LRVLSPLLSFALLNSTAAFLVGRLVRSSSRKHPRKARELTKKGVP
jgi:hypothetical protein